MAEKKPDIFYLLLLAKLRDKSTNGIIPLEDAREIISYFQIKKVLINILIENMVQIGLVGRCGKHNCKLVINETEFMKKNPEFYNNYSLMYEYIGALKTIE